MRQLLLSAGALMVSGCAFGQIHVGLFDDFQDGTTMGWIGPNAFTVPNGGPGGAGDIFMEITADGSGQGGALAARNESDWIGNYLAAGVTNITMMIENFNSVQLEMRIVLFDGATHARWTSSTAAIVPPGSGWQSVNFSLAQVSLVEVLGTSTYSSMINNVERCMIRHDAGTASSGGTSIVGSVGIDNIRAVPEPASLVSICLGLALLQRGRRDCFRRSV